MPYCMEVDETKCIITYRLHGVGHLGNDEVMEAGGRELDPRPGHYYSRMSF